MAVAFVVLGWRVWTLPFRDLSRDWVSILSAFLILATLGKSRVFRLGLTLAAVLLLLGIYVSGQFHHTLSVLGLAP